MLSDAHRQRLIAGRCWEVYDLITRNFTVQPEFTSEFPELAEQALITGALSLRIQIEQDRFLQIEEDRFLQIEEEYDFDWNLEKKMQLIQAAYDALPAGGAFVVIENLIDDARRENVFGLMMSLNMLIEFGDAFYFTAADFFRGVGRWASVRRK